MLIVLAVACGGGDDDIGDEVPSQTSGDTASALPTVDVTSVPELADGVLSFGLDFKFPPMAYTDEATQSPAGFEVDLANALAEHLGVTAEFHQVAHFDTIVADAKARIYEAVMASIPITTEKQEEINLVRYLGPVGMGILVRTDNPAGILLLEDLCDRDIAVPDSTNLDFYIEETNADFCGTTPIKAIVFPDYAGGAEAVLTGEADAQLAEDPAVAFAASRSNGEMTQALVGFDSHHYGIGVSKESPDLTMALEQAFDAIRAEGIYGEIIAEWGLEDFIYER